MASRTIYVTEYSQPTRTFLVTNADLGSELDPGTAADLTGYACKLVVRQNDVDLEDAVLFSLAGTVTAVDSTVSFALTAEHTALPAGSYPAEIRLWASGTTTEPPSESWPCSYIVSQAVVRS